MRKPEYFFTKEIIGNEVHYFVELSNSGIKTEVTQDVYQALTRSIWCEEKMEKRDQERCASLEWQYSYNAEEQNGLRMEQKHRQLQCMSAEDVYFQQAFSEQLAFILLSNCSESELNLVIAIFFDRLTEQQYSDRLGIPRSTLHSQKTSLCRKLKKIFSNL